MAEYKLVFPEDANSRLAEFDLTVSDIHDHVMRAGLQAAGGVSPLAPPGAPGRHAHDYYVAGLRGVLLGHGWKVAQRDGVARTVHYERKLALIVGGGNEFTARADGANYLTTAWHKGDRALANAILPPQVGFEAVDESGFNWGTADKEEPKWVVWYLLHYRTETEIRLELSSPTRLDEKGFPRGWYERIMLPPYVLSQAELEVETRDDDDTGGEPNVPVTPR
ncbi:hypothetical protein [Mycobacteroides abscessus]|uniref:hypothetical protein n=1 Tax=Mycobacteroides abscessus TaxID=36809 RepID=UPI000928747D|nr:hypothetical protein [Mycobacteroides abscessus]MBE5451643.1 hypothetical protein [Mycobacteroides abscessus]MBE5466756.1 hypothetical protein [Mycobacteroides abscessus]MBN7366743.1 hypothetical protein [Mycobacteroides abscessus subsp. abscessus]MBN7450378.1 hypothetical protein [Mycobacteroides abscessus subsp. abscessus]MBN7490989.1 hypothetical protein [Mycobacteroides abscessus subsp. abscessus]